MKRTLACLMSVLLLMLSSQALAAHSIVSGTVEAGQTLTLRAASGGTVQNVLMEEGMYLTTGQTLLTFRSTRLFAPFDGTVTGLTAKEGNILSSDGTLLSLEPREKFTMSASTEQAYQVAENIFVHNGEIVFLSCVVDASHQGYGIVTNVSGSTYTVIPMAGEFYTGEAVNVFRSDEGHYTQRIGRATVYRAAPTAVTATGLITRVFAENGDRVQKGEALADIVSNAELSSLESEMSGIIISVSVNPGAEIKKGDEIARIVSDNNLLIVCRIPESDIGILFPNVSAKVTFSCDPTETPYEARLESISSAGESGEDGVTYEARFSLITAPDDLRLGMSASVSY